MDVSDWNSIGLGTLQFPSDFNKVLIEIAKKDRKVHPLGGTEIFDTHQRSKVLLDFARVYQNEIIIGDFFRNNPALRASFVLLNKVGISFNENPYATPAELQDHLNDAYDRVGKVEMMALHRINHQWNSVSHFNEIDTLYTVLVNFWKEGKCDYIGISECTADVLEYLAKKFLVHFIEIAWSPASRRAEKNGVLKVANEFGIKVITYTSIVRGLCNSSVLDLDLTLTAEEIQNNLFELLNITGFERTVGFYQTDVIKKNLEITHNFIRLAQENGITPTRLSLLCAVHNEFIPIPGSTKLERIMDNLFCEDIVSVTVIEEALRITEEFKGNPNPNSLEQFDETVLEVTSAFPKLPSFQDKTALEINTYPRIPPERNETAFEKY